MKRRKVRIDPKILRKVEQDLQIHPDYPDFQNRLGLVRMREGKIEEAKTCFLEALRLNPDYREALLNLACLYMDLERWHEAGDLLRSRSRRFRRDGFYQHVLAVLYFIVGRPQQAARQVRKAIRLRPLYQEYYGRLELWQKGAVTLRPRGLAFLRKVPSRHLEANFRNFIGLHHAQEGRFNRAAGEIQKAARLEPNASLIHFNLGFLRFLQGLYPQATQEFRKGLKIDPNYGNGHAHLSYTYGAMGRFGRAVQSLERAVQLNPGYADLHYNLALLYSGRRWQGEAVVELRKALRINPNYLVARINLGAAYEDLGKWGAARREYQKVLRITPEDDHVRKRLAGLAKR